MPVAAFFFFSMAHSAYRDVAEQSYLLVVLEVSKGMTKSGRGSMALEMNRLGLVATTGYTRYEHGALLWCTATASRFSRC